MTREEIENTPKIVDYMLSDALLLASRENLHKRLEEICKLAIKILDQEPTTKNDLGVAENTTSEPIGNSDKLDCISRQAVLNTLENMDKALTEDRTVETYKELLIACINDLTPVYQEPKEN